MCTFKKGKKILKSSVNWIYSVLERNQLNWNKLLKLTLLTVHNYLTLNVYLKEW